jgi:hypothetical protein
MTNKEILSQIEILEKQKHELYMSVKDMDSADSIKTDKAISGMRQYDSQIKSLQRKLKI